MAMTYPRHGRRRLIAQHDDVNQYSTSFEVGRYSHLATRSGNELNATPQGVASAIVKFMARRSKIAIQHRAKPWSPAVWPNERLVGKIVESVVGLQKRLDPLAQLGIAHAFAIQDRGAIRKFVIVCSFQENGLHTLWV
jgi:hypothetical protein